MATMFLLLLLVCYWKQIFLILALLSILYGVFITR